MARDFHRCAEAPGKILEDRRALADRSRPAERGLPYLGLRRSQRARQGARRCRKRPGLERIPRQERVISGRDAFDDYAAGAAFTAEIETGLMQDSQIPATQQTDPARVVLP